MASEAEKAAPPKRGWGGLLLLLVVAGLMGGAGFAVPRFLMHSDTKPTAKDAKPVIVPFGDVVVNLGEDRLTRYLRVKLLLVIDGNQEKTITDHVTKHKAFLKNWLIGYLSDQSVQEVSRASGVNRVRREIRDQFNALLYPDGSEKIQDVLFDEFVVQ